MTTPDSFVSGLSGGVESSEVGGCTSVLTTIVVICGHIPSIPPFSLPLEVSKNTKWVELVHPKLVFFVSVK